jgi:predicted AlkP superfamily phosphohydrolase/phosphomutase
MTDQKVIIFGLDGACFDLIGDWIQEGVLPTLAELIDRGDAAELQSCTPATTPPAWSSLTTGVNPGKHGVFGFYRRVPDSYAVQPVSDTDVRANRLWDYTSTEDLTSLVVNVPVTHPGREINGAIIPGYLSPEDFDTYPEDVLSTVKMEDYRVYAPSESDDVSEDQLLSEWIDLTKSRRDLSLRLMQHYDWDLLFVEFQKTDGAVHKFDNQANVRRIFECVDQCMADILEVTAGDPNVLVVSDHGIGRSKEWSVALNTWVVENGYATTTVGSGQNRSWRNDGEETMQSSGATALTGLLNTLSTVGITKQTVERVLVAAGLYNLATQVLPEGIGESMNEEVIDESSSEAFYQGMGFSGVDTGVVINSRAFYEEGVVDPEKYEPLREALLDALRDLRGPDDQRAFEAAQPREAVYEGPYVEEAPDIVLRQSDDYVIGSSDPRGKTFIPAGENRIDHTDTGLLVAAGPDVVAGWSSGRTPSITDVTPTLLHLLDVPLNERFDGEPIDILTTNYPPEWKDYDRRHPHGETEFTDSERFALEERLKGMGYLE